MYMCVYRPFLYIISIKARSYVAKSVLKRMVRIKEISFMEILSHLCGDDEKQRIDQLFLFVL